MMNEGVVGKLPAANPPRGPAPLFTGGAVSITPTHVLARDIAVPIGSIIDAQVKKGMSLAQTGLGLLGGLLLLMSFFACGLSREGGQMGAAAPGALLVLVILVMGVGSALPSPHTAILRTANGVVRLFLNGSSSWVPDTSVRWG
jgi:hypothetical protein